MKIYTKTGDNGETSLCNGQRVKKSSLRVAAYGEIDELSSNIGLIQAINKDKKINKILHQIQKDLFILGAHIANPDIKTANTLPKFTTKNIEQLEKFIDKTSKQLPKIKKFILPGGSLLASQLHIARTICRRAERTCTTLEETEYVFQNVLPYLNRLSDLLFVAARYANKGNDIFT